MVKPEKKIAKKTKRGPRSVNFTELRAKLEKKRGSRSADFTELRDDLFREAAKLVAEDPSQRIAILVTPPASSESNVAMQSFGYPSAESVVQKFLKDTEEDEEKEEDDDDEEDEDWSKNYWWDDEKLLNSKDPVEILAAITEMEKLRKQLEHFVPGQGSGTQDDGSKP